MSAVTEGVLAVFANCEIPAWELDNEDWDDSYVAIVAAKREMMAGRSTTVDTIMQSPEIQAYLREKVEEAFGFIQNFVQDNEVTDEEF